MTLSCRLASLRRPPPTPALQSLLEDAALSRSALANCATPVVVVEAFEDKFIVRFANRAFERMTGITEEALRGRDLDSAVFADAVVHRSVDSGAALECRLRMTTGQTLAVELIAARLRTASGTAVHWVVTLHDRSEVARLRSEVAALRSADRSAEKAAVSLR